ncbi:N-acetylglucosaminyl deacetylase, LmbE family [Palleronia marisminoris]|uniref:Glucosamine-6-phosphate deaminase-like protein n=1 Tax=Palleronia marisminoris TaxID=315423 RepID=A0A1Y5S8E0_9RHOB|nr:PIG-L deacetylase family protein [Palleronia marisminoris]SFG68069.1 N-acetylglucosaminyl deacetylase, LmbE family [Palleronia marisminoris]SLN34770.1 glucosamine-6-phosphate deaminase-like protein [Palleronia marisminoris]
MILSVSEAGVVLVIAPHPDDEVLGAGGTIARLAAAGREVHVCIATRGRTDRFGPDQVATVSTEAEAAHRRLGVARTHWLDHPAAELDTEPHGALNASLGALLSDLAPQTLLVPHLGDIHRDHQLVFLSALVAARPTRDVYPANIFAYETLSETNWNAPYLTPPFVPNVFVDISETLETKLEAFALFESQVRPSPHERSIEALRALATLRGATIHRRAAEGFVAIRQCC